MSLETATPNPPAHLWYNTEKKERDRKKMTREALSVSKNSRCTLSLSVITKDFSSSQKVIKLSL